MESLARTANRGSISTGYDIDFSCKFEADNQEELLRTPSSAGNRQTWTVSMWFKFTELGINQMLFGSSDTYMYLGNDDKMYINYRGAGTNFFLATNRVFRDTAAFYHFVVVCDATNGTAADRGRFYVNGVRETDYQLNTYQNMDSGDSTHWNNTVAQSIGGQNGSTTFQSCGYMAEVHSVDGSALTSDSFGEFDSDTGIWIPKEYSGSYGTNGFYLDFADASDLGDDESGNGNDFAETNLTAADQATDTPTNNFCIGNALVNFAPGGQTLVNGATKFSNPSGQNWQTITGTFGLTSGKWYWEFETDGTGAFVGIADVQDSIIPQNTGGYFLGYGDDNSATTKSLGMYSANGVIYNDSGSATGNSYGSGNRVGVALDMDNRKIYFAVGNTWVNSGDPANGTNGATWNTSWSDTVFPAGSCAQNNSIFFVYGGFSSLSNISNVDANGYGGFYYTPPSGFYALCTKNLAEYG
tara:strand:- start:1586 stop:2992 length:1407 start_codon:yes stop_codon:yes gene_type:complete